jgi:hypothetical protein
VLAAKLVVRCHKIAKAFVPQRELGAAMLVEGLALLAVSDGGVAALVRVRKLVDAFERRTHPTHAAHLIFLRDRRVREGRGHNEVAASTFLRATSPAILAGGEFSA